MGEIIIIPQGPIISPPFSDNTALVQNNADNTKLVIFSAASISTGTTRTYTLQNRNGTLADNTDLALKANLASPTFTGAPLAPTATQNNNSTQISTTAYVDLAVANALAGVNPAVSVKAATTQASDTSGLTYLNGVSGVGATFTGTINTPLVFDGVTLTALLQRVLIKNDIQSPSGAFNGVYYLSQLQTGLLPPILMRALDYDQPSDINNTGAIPVISGTTNASTSWIITSTINTVGTDSLSFTQFSYNPTTLVTVTGTQILTNKRITLRVGTETTNTATSINSDSYDEWTITALASANTITTTGTPTEGQSLLIRIKDNGTARALTFNSIFRASSDLALPTTTIISKTLYLGFKYNATDSKWDLLALLNNF